MPDNKPSQYHAYSIASRTVAKTRQVVMLYDGAIRYLKQAEAAIAENRVEERYKLLKRASDIMVGLQSAIDFEAGGEMANTLHHYYSGISRRILSVNMKKDEGKALCAEIIDDVKQMRDIWDSVDKSLNSPEGKPVPEPPSAAEKAADKNVSLSA